MGRERGGEATGRVLTSPRKGPPPPLAPSKVSKAPIFMSVRCLLLLVYNSTVSLETQSCKTIHQKYIVVNMIYKIE